MIDVQIKTTARDLPDEVAFLVAVGDPMGGAAAVEYDLIRQV
jgi:hypothetical protein